jgi:outer membrane protein assembly factor BamB
LSTAIGFAPCSVNCYYSEKLSESESENFKYNCEEICAQKNRRRKKMQIVKNKTKAIAIALCLVFALSASLVLLPTANAHTPAWQIPVYAYINVTPSTVGVGQTVTVVVWVDKMPDMTSIYNDVRFKNYKLTITDPDGHTETKTWDVIWDTTSSANTVYTPTKVGTYTFKFDFPAQDYTWTGPIQGWFGPPMPSDYVNDTYMAASATTTITVQQEAVPTYPQYPLPTEYWSRPIEGENTMWSTIASNYLDPFGAAYSPGVLRFQPDGTAPNSAHIMWTKPVEAGGIVGGSNTGVAGAGFYPGLSYETKFNEPIIIYGRLYYGLPRSNDGSGGGYVCVDLRTGEQIWKQSYPTDPTFASLEWFDSPNQHGVIPSGYLWAVSGGFNYMTFQMEPTTWTAYDAWDGSQLFSITDVPDGIRGYGPNGELLIYQLDVANKWLALWNVTDVITNGGGGALEFTGYRPVGQTFNSSQRASYSWNVTIPTLPSDAAVNYAVYDDMLFGSAHVANVFGQAFFGGVGDAPSNAYGTFWAISLKPTSRGSLLWTKDIPAKAGNVSSMLGPLDTESRVFFISDKETMQWSGYDLDSGKYLWGPVGKTRSLNYYPTVGSGGVSQVGFVAYGKLYSGGYGGEFFCYDSKTGNLLWKYNNTDSGFEEPWGLMPIFPAAIADGKVYLYNGEHSPNSPLYKGEKVYCLNATTGAEIWTMLSWYSVGGFADEGCPVADGEIAYMNAYDMQVYAIGKGPSATTVEAPMTGVTAGNSMVIRGTVTDISAGTTQNEQAARFPHGVPAMSDESMSAWMEYVYMQKPIPANATGVTVSIDSIDPNGNFVHLGTATSDISGLYSLDWKTPDVPGKYTIIATFAGSNSYYGSYSETAAVVTEVPAASPAPTPTPVSMAEQYFMPMSIGMIVAIIVVGALLALLLLRKRP